MVLLAILGWVVLGLLLLLVLVLVTPIHLRFAAEAADQVHFSAEVRVVSARAPRLFRVAGGGGEVAAERPERAERSVKPRRKREKRGGGSGVPGWARRLLRATPQAILDTFGAFHVDRLRVAGCFGLDDPADTGLVWGWLAPLVYGGLSGPVDLSLAPRFDGAGVEGEAEAALHFTPIRVLWPGIALVLRAAPWRA